MDEETETIDYDGYGDLSATVPYELQKDSSHVHFTLPFEFTSDMTIEVSGAIKAVINVADHYKEKGVKFKLVSSFDQTLFPDGTQSIPDTLLYEISVGEGDDMFIGSDTIGEENYWTKMDKKHWELK